VGISQDYRTTNERDETKMIFGTGTAVSGPGRAVISLTRIAGCLFALAAGSASAENGHNLDDIRDAARTFAVREATAAHSRAVVEPGSLDPRLRLAPCAAPLQAFLPPGGRLAGNAAVGVRCPSAWTVYVPVRVRFDAKVLVSMRAIGRGETLRATDFRLETRDLAALPGPAITEPSRAVGQQTAVPIAPGAVLTPRMVKQPRLVRRGDRVTIIARAGGLEVRSSGEALADGVEGDSIQVRNVLTKKIIQGTVSEPGLVSVRL
jgi:flagella basal body P-ring formation protein FlgA